MQRVGLFGGTFDPVHEGHLLLVEVAKKELALDTVRIIPAADPPHKDSNQVTTFEHRFKMMQLALEECSNIELSDLEKRLPKPSYTIDTIRWLLGNEPVDNIYFFIIGEDSFAELMSWKEYDLLLQLITIVVARRSDYHSLNELETIASSLGYRPHGKAWKKYRPYNDIIFLEAKPPPISSSHIRESLLQASAKPVGLNPKVLSYIKANQLYGASSKQRNK